MQLDFTPKVQMTVILDTAHIIVLSDAVHMLIQLIISKNRPLQLCFNFVFSTQTTCCYSWGQFLSKFVVSLPIYAHQLEDKMNFHLRILSIVLIGKAKGTR